MSDIDRAATAADAIADNLHRARTSLGHALHSIDVFEGQLQEASRAASRLTEQAVSLATDASLVPADQPSGELSPGDLAAHREAEYSRRDALGVRLAGIRNQAEDLHRQLMLAPVTTGAPDAGFVEYDAKDHLASAANSLTIADNALDGLRAVEGHDEKTADRLEGLANVLRNPVAESRDILEVVDNKLTSARAELAQLSRSDYLSTDQAPADLAHRIAATGLAASADISMAQRELARVEGRVDTLQRPARDAAHGSADLAAMKGLNPPVREDQRTNAGSAQGAAAGGSGRDRDKGGQALT